MGVRGKHRNVYYALGYSGHGVTLANLAGRVLADIYAGDDTRWRDLPFYRTAPALHSPRADALARLSRLYEVHRPIAAQELRGDHRRRGDAEVRKKKYDCSASTRLPVILSSESFNVNGGRNDDSSRQDLDRQRRA